VTGPGVGGHGQHTLWPCLGAGVRRPEFHGWCDSATAPRASPPQARAAERRGLMGARRRREKPKRERGERRRAARERSGGGRALCKAVPKARTKSPGRAWRRRARATGRGPKTAQFFRRGFGAGTIADSKGNQNLNHAAASERPSGGSDLFDLRNRRYPHHCSFELSAPRMWLPDARQVKGTPERSEQFQAKTK